ncbi:MAG: SLOG family protein [Actinomycetota bacterium]|nr:SLOG family protein [Actinomycetota bacterium]
MAVDVYTDGACLGNPGPGGWAWAVEGGRFASGVENPSTNQRMEINAALAAVRALDGALVVVSDSTYVVNCFRDGWWEGWLARGWMNKARKPVANQDLWKPLVELVRERGDVSFRWVKGHSGDPMNDLVDRLAVEAATTRQGRTGEGRPEALGAADLPGRVVTGPGPADLPGAGGRPLDEVPVGHLVAVTGHRPPELGGYDPNPVALRVRTKLVEILAATAEIQADLVVLTGLGLGAEQLGAEAAAEAGVPYVAVLAFPGQDERWPQTSRCRYRELLAGAAGQVVVAAKVPATKGQAGVALARRDAWLARHADEAVVVWDRQEATVGRLARSFQDALGETEVWLLEP